MIIGFTGSQKGMTQRQMDALAQLFWWLPVSGLRHGDCIGGDSQAHSLYLLSNNLASEDDIQIHPPIDNKKRAFRKGVYVTSPLPYLRRNRYIAGCVAGFNTDLLIAAPSTMTEIVRSGTWATVRYARRCGTPRIILLP